MCDLIWNLFHLLIIVSKIYARMLVMRSMTANLLSFQMQAMIMSSNDSFRQAILSFDCDLF